MKQQRMIELINNMEEYLENYDSDIIATINKEQFTLEQKYNNLLDYIIELLYEGDLSARFFKEVLGFTNDELWYELLDKE